MAFVAVVVGGVGVFVGRVVSLLLAGAAVVLPLWLDDDSLILQEEREKNHQKKEPIRKGMGYERESDRN